MAPPDRIGYSVAETPIAMTAAQPPLPAPDAVPAPLRERLLTGLALSIFCTVGFFGIAYLNARHQASGAPYIPLETALDRVISFDPRWIWIYLSYYPGCFLPLVGWNRRALFRQVALGYAIEFGACFVSFALIPARMAQPSVPGGGWNEWAVRKLFEIDPGFNIFPSLHVANVLLIAAVLARFDRRFAVPAWIWAILVSISTVTVKQHYAVDVLAGATLAAITIRLVLVRWDGLWPGERAAMQGGIR